MRFLSRPYKTASDKAHLTVSLSILAFILMYGIFFCLMPGYMDEFWYAKDIFAPGQGGVFNGVLNTIRLHCNYDNARVANMIYCFFLLIPKWIGGILATAAFAYVILAGRRLTGINREQGKTSIFKTSFFLFLMAFCLPWYDTMGSECYQFNYILSSMLATMALMLFFGTGRQAHSVAFLLFGIFTGAWHEGFSVPLIAGFSACLVFFPKTRTRNNLFLTIGLIIGFSFLVCAPSFFMRLNSVSENKTLSPGHIAAIILMHPAFVLMFIFTGIALIRKIRLRSPLFICLVAAAVCSFVIHIFSTKVPRTGWFCELSSIFAILIISNSKPTKPGESKRWSKFSTTASIILLGLTFAHLIIVDMNVIKIRNQFNYALKSYVKNPAEPIFMDFDTEHTANLLSWYAPDYTLFNAPANILLISEYFDNGHEFRVIPARLADASSENGTPVNSNLDIRQLDSHLFMPTDSTDNFEIIADVDFGIIKRRNVRLICYPFVSRKDDRRYAYIYPWRCMIEGKLGCINEIIEYDSSLRRPSCQD